MPFEHNQSEGKSPRLTLVSPVKGKEYLTAAHKWCLKQFPAIVPLFINGLAPIEMLEHEPELLRRALLARKAGRYKDKEGKLAEKSQTMVSYREEIISNTLINNSAVCEGDEDAALELLFPSSGLKSRGIKRSLIENQAQSFLQCLMLLWPSEEVQLTMSLDEDLKTATERNDLIAWTLAFDKFCSSNSGNKYFNVRDAEAALKAIKMKGYDTPNYIKAYKQAASDARVCGSVQSEDDVVAQFFLNMNQATDAFFRYDYRHLDSLDAVAALVKKPLQSALDHAMEFHKTTILSAQARKRADNPQGQVAVTSTSELEKLASGGNNKGSLVTMPHAVMMTFFNNNKNNKRPRDNKPPDVKAPNGGKPADKNKKKKVGFEEKPPADAVGKEEKAQPKCFRFPTAKGCHYGDTCKFSHVA